MGESSFVSFPPQKWITGLFFTLLFKVHAHFFAELLTQGQTLLAGFFLGIAAKMAPRPFAFFILWRSCIPKGGSRI